MAENNIMNPEEFEESDSLGTVVLTLDDDTELTCSIVAIYPVGDRQYIALLPEDEDSDEVLIYRFIENENDIDLENIDDDDEYDAAADAFDELLDDADFFDYDDDSDEDDDDDDSEEEDN